MAFAAANHKASKSPSAAGLCSVARHRLEL